MVQPNDFHSKMAGTLAFEAYTPREDKKEWGREIIFAREDEYAGKLLVFDKAGDNFSYHFHKDKKETWYVLQGSFTVILNTADPTQGYKTVFDLEKGECLLVQPPRMHQLIAKENDSVIIEVSTKDSFLDNHRITRKNLLNE